MGTFVSIMQAGNLLVTFLVATEQLALKIKSHFELDPDFTVNITTLTGDAVKSNDGTIADVNAWRQSVGLAPLASSTPPPAVAG
jgi:hypothetical protein